jgi:CRISPR-associated endonuclease/helicase Cas3
MHPLVDHCLDVAVTFSGLARLRGIRKALQSTTPTALTEVHVSRLAALAFLHDIGKCNWGFQAKCDPDAKEIAGHVREAAALLIDDGVCDRWPELWRGLLETMCDWFDGGDEVLFEMLLAAISHHGRPVSINDYRNCTDRNLARWWSHLEGPDPMEGLVELSGAVRRSIPAAFAGGGEPIQAPPALQQRFAGLVMLADWIGSDTQFFPYRMSPDEDRLAVAQHAANRALHAIGLALPAARRPSSFVDTFGFSPHPLQAYLAETLICREENRLLLVESDTGSGKTEAALAWFLRLYARGDVDGLYFALPTRVAAREIYDRVRGAVNTAFTDPADRPGPVLLAATGYVRVDGEPAALPDPQFTLWEDDAAARRRERLWAAERPKRFLAAPVAVGTIDQALLSVLKVKHSLLRSVCLDRHLLVVDEVHASDPYMSEILQALLHAHIARGGWALLLSATLGDSACSRYFNREPLPLDRAIARPYPAISSRGEELAVASSGRRKEVSIEFHDSLDDGPLLPLLTDALAQGARVLVVCNTVARANALLRAVQAQGAIDPGGLFQVGGIACPHHGRFALEDREAMDAAVSAQLGKQPADGPLLLIGTQTLEQSLDIDADWLVTDLCPMDVLLQRIGRLHRHRRPSRPAAFSGARVLLQIPEGGDLADYIGRDGQCRGPAGIGRVYEDARVLQRTLDVLREQPRIALPDDNRRLVELATHPEALSRLEGQLWRRHGEWIEGALLGKLREALANTVDEMPFGELQYRTPDERVTTRLGASDLSLPLAEPVLSPFGCRLTRISLPSHLIAPAAVIPETLRAEPTAEGFAFDLGARRYRYTRFGLEIDDA